MSGITTIGESIHCPKDNEAIMRIVLNTGRTAIRLQLPLRDVIDKGIIQYNDQYFIFVGFIDGVVHFGLADLYKVNNR